MLFTAGERRRPKERRSYGW